MAAILTDPPGSHASRCEACGAAFGCGIDDPCGCWCATLPALAAPPAPGAGCLCPACLARVIERERATDPARTAERSRTLAAAGVDAVPRADDGEA
ncbi:MAG: cysteine-rich CWC family protein, partial [Burkholderiales bacterium]